MSYLPHAGYMYETHEPVFGLHDFLVLSPKSGCGCRSPAACCCSTSVESAASGAVSPTPVLFRDFTADTGLLRNWRFGNEDLWAAFTLAWFFTGSSQLGHLLCALGIF